MSEHPFSPGHREFCDYLRSPAGRLRVRILTAQLDAQLAAVALPRRVIDVGCGVGALGLSLARRGCVLTLVDPVSELLEIARSAARELRLPRPPRLLSASLAELPERLPDAEFDLVICHCLFEYLPDAADTMARLSTLLAPGGYLSLAVLNGPQEVLRQAVREGDTHAALAALQHPVTVPSLYGVDRHPSDPAALRALARAADLRVLSLQGVCVVGDYLAPEGLGEPERFEAVLQLELAAGAHPVLSQVGRYLHLWARSPSGRERAANGSPAGVDTQER